MGAGTEKRYFRTHVRALDIDYDTSRKHCLGPKMNYIEESYGGTLRSLSGSFFQISGKDSHLSSVFGVS